MKHALIAFAVGAFGGMSPTLLRIAQDLVTRSKKVEDALDVGVAIGLALFGILGGVFAAAC
jgi:membrane associated rhomboid family serine protease